MHKTFSAHMLKSFQECPYKYFLEYEKKVHIPQDISLADTGKTIHALINYHLKGFETNKLEKSLNKDEKALWQNFLNLKIEKSNLFASEYGFNVRINKENWLTGRIDAIIKEDSNYTIYDWKTGKLPEKPEEDLQTIIYLFALKTILENNYPSAEKRLLRFVYLNLKTTESIDVFIQDETSSTSANKLHAIIEEIQEFSKVNHYPKHVNLQNSAQNSTKNTYCSLCKFKTICKTDVFL